MRLDTTTLSVCLGLSMLGLLVGGCGYQTGSIMHPQVSSMAVGEFENRTREPSLEVTLRSKLSEQIMTDGSVKLTAPDTADSILVGRIVSFSTRAMGSTKQRSEAATDEDSDEYQTSIYRAEVRIEYELRVPGYATPLVAMQEVTGTADFSRLPDMEIPRREALRIALNDAAVRMVSSVTEAW